MKYTYEILNNGELSVYCGQLHACFITDMVGVSLQEKINYFNTVFNS